MVFFKLFLSKMEGAGNVEALTSEARPDLTFVSGV